jgi:hypothetical protein
MITALRKWPRYLLLAYGLFLAVATAALQRTSAHSTSRLATVESLVARGTFAIDASTFADTIDKVKVGEHFYSHQPPGHAVLSALLYFPLHHLGLRFSPRKSAALAILTFLTNGLSTILALAVFYRALAWFNLRQSTRLPVAGGVACGTLILPYSTTYNVHGLVAAWLFIGFYCFLRAGMEESPRRWMLGSGLAFSACAALDHGTVFLYAAFCVLLLARRESRELLWFVLPACVTLVPTAAYYYVIGGSFKPLAARAELFAYAGSPWTDPSSPQHESLTGGEWNSPRFAIRYGFLCLFGPRGFLIYNPLIWVAIYGLGITVGRRLRFWQEAVTIALGSVGMMLYFFFASTNYSGVTYSIRWFVAFLFLWGFFAGPVAEQIASRRWLAIPVAVLAGVSLLYALGGVANPWIGTADYLTPLHSLHQVGRDFWSKMFPRGQGFL